MFTSGFSQRCTIENWFGAISANASCLDWREVAIPSPEISLQLPEKSLDTEHKKYIFLGIFLDLQCIYFSLEFFLLAPLFMVFFLPVEISPGMITQPQQLCISWFGKWMNLRDLVVSEECLKQLTEWRVSALLWALAPLPSSLLLPPQSMNSKC